MGYISESYNTVKKLSICCVSVVTWQHIFSKPRGLITLLWYAMLLIDIVHYASCCTGIPHEILSTGSTYFVSEAFSNIPWPSSADSYLGDGSVVLMFWLKSAKMASDFFFKTYYVLIPFLHYFYIGSCTCKSCWKLKSSQQAPSVQDAFNSVTLWYHTTSLCQTFA